MSTVGFSLFIALFFVIGFCILSYGIYSFRASQSARYWPTAEGTVVSCELGQSTDSDGATTYRALVKYRYTVENQSYLGDRIAFGYSGTSARAGNQEIVDRLSSAKKILVRYDPANAAKAVLSYGLNRSTILLLVFAATWLLFVTGFTALWCLSSSSDCGVVSTLVVTE